MGDLQDRLTAVTESAANLVAQLTELNHLRERVRKASEIAVPETHVVMAATPVLIWRAAAINSPAAGV